MPRQDSQETSTSCFVVMSVVGVFAVGIAALLWRVSPALAALLTLLAWPSIGWVVAVAATRMRFGRTMSLQITLGLLVATFFRATFLLFLTGLALLFGIMAFAIVSSIIFGAVGLDSVEDVPWLVPLSASAVALLALAYTGHHVLWPLVREFWGVDTGECEWQTSRNDCFDAHRARQLDRFANQTGRADSQH